MRVATAASSSDLPCACRAERSASPMVVGSRGHPFIEHIGAMQKIVFVRDRILALSAGDGNLFADDFPVGILAAAELLQLLNGHEDVAGLGAFRGADHTPLLELVHDPA